MHISANRPPSQVIHDRSYEAILVDAISGESPPVAQPASPGTITIRLRLDRPGLPQLLRVAERYRPARELHILCPGEIDRIVLGTTVVTRRALREDCETRSAFSALGQLLGDDAALVLGGANVGWGEAGQAFLQALADLVQSEVSALVRIAPRAPHHLTKNLHLKSLDAEEDVRFRANESVST